MAHCVHPNTPWKFVYNLALPWSAKAKPTCHAIIRAKVQPMSFCAIPHGRESTAKAETMSIIIQARMGVSSLDNITASIPASHAPNMTPHTRKCRPSPYKRKGGTNSIATTHDINQVSLAG